MRISDIPRPRITRQDPEPVKELKRDAPKHLKALLDRSIVFVEVDLETLKEGDIQLLSGGINAVAYLVRRHNDYVVVKFDLRTMHAEAEALEVWWRQGARVVQMKSAGTSPLLKDGEKSKVRYLILEGVLGSGNRPAELAIDFVRKYPGEAERVGRYMGRQLAVMHRAMAKRTFGEYADMHGEHKPYRSWNAYLNNYVDRYRNDLKDMGYSDARIKQLKRYIRNTTFARGRRYIHGDFSLRNALVESRDPLKIRIIDPNPLIGNIHWDLAIVCNNAEIAHRKAFIYAGDRSLTVESQIRVGFWHGVHEGYSENTRRKIDGDKLAVTRLVHMIMLTMIWKHGLDESGVSPEDDLNFIVHRNLLSELMVKVLSGLDASPAIPRKR
jgi:fructosamine-3-kinase